MKVPRFSLLNHASPFLPGCRPFHVCAFCFPSSSFVPWLNGTIILWSLPCVFSRDNSEDCVVDEKK